MGVAPQYTLLNITFDEKLEIMNEMYDILFKKGAQSAAKAIMSEEIEGSLHTSRILKNLSNANNNDAVTYTGASIVGSVAGAMVNLEVLEKINPQGKNKAKWYISGPKTNISKEKLQEKNL